MSTSHGTQTPNVVRQQIVSCLFSPSSDHGTLVSHLKVWEDVISEPTESHAEKRKPRFIILAVQRNGRLKIHKAKRNANGTFSIGKTWNLEDLQLIWVHNETSFTVTFGSRPNRWNAEHGREQQEFLVATVRSFRSCTSNDVRLEGFSVPDGPLSQPPYTRVGARSVSRASVASSVGGSSHAGASSLARPMTPNSPGPIGSSRPRHFNQLPLLASAALVEPRPSVAGSVFSQVSGSTVVSRITDGHQPQVHRQRSFGPMPTSPPPPPRTQSRPSNMTAEQKVQSLRADTTAFATRTSHSGAMSPSSRPHPMSPGLGVRKALISARTRAPTASQTVQTVQPDIEGIRGSNAHRKTHNDLRSNQKLTSSDVAILAVSTLGQEFEDGVQTLANVEEMLEGFEWRNNTGGAAIAVADRIEQRLVDELQAHEAAGIHAIVESDDRVSYIVKHLDEAIAELDKLDQLVSLYRTQLNIVSDDIDHIESQNKGLQVLISNQRALLSEIEDLLNTMNIPEADIQALHQQSFDNQSGIDNLEQIAASLYKAMLSTRGEYAAASELASDYQRYCIAFSKRFSDFLATVFVSQTEHIVNNIPRIIAKSGLEPHAKFEDYLGRYCGLMLFVKEMDGQRYQQICGNYLTSSSALYRQEISALVAFFKAQSRKSTDDEAEASFVAAAAASAKGITLKRMNTQRTPPESKRAKGPIADQIQGSEGFRRALAQLGPHVTHEQEWATDFLQIRGPDSYFTFAEYMDLDTVFRRQATTYCLATLKDSRDIRATMELIFGSLPQELNEMVDFCLQRDNMQVIGLLSALDECIAFADGVGNEFLGRTLQRLYQRLIGQMERMAKEQIQAIEATKVTVKKRKGIVPFIQVFPAFVDRIESQLYGSERLPIRRSVDAMYDDIVKTMFECLQQMAKMGGDSGEADKDQLNYHVVLIENMHHFTTTARELRGPAIESFARQARELYDENLVSYANLILRRPLGKLMDFFSGLQALLKTTPPNEVNLHPAFNKSSFRRIVGSIDVKDLRKVIEALARRVDKHFNDILNPSAQNAQVVIAVWRACQDEAMRLTGAWIGLLVRCYGDNAALEYNVEDVRDAFRRVTPHKL